MFKKYYTGEVRERQRQACRKWYKEHGRDDYYKNHVRSLRIRKAWRDRLREQILKSYGRVCNCCNEGREEFLALDHVDPKTKTDLKETGSKLYKKARDAGFPETYQLLCHNCNMSKGFYGYCPHDVERGVKKSVNE